MLTPVFLRAWIATFGVFFSFGIVVYALPLYTKDSLAAGDFGVGIAMGTASITAILFAAPSGRLADRRGRRLVIVAGAAIMVVGYVALAFGPSLAAVAAIRVFAGIGEAAFVVVIYTLVIDIAPEERRGEAASLATVASYTGIAIGPLVANVVVDGERFAEAWLLAAAAATVSMLVALALPETRPPTAEAAPAGWLPHRAALGPGFALLLALFGFGGFNAFVVLYARELGFERPGLVFALFAVVVLLVRSVGRKIPDRLGGRRAAILACVCLAAGLLTMGAWRSEPGLILGTVVFAAGQSLAFPAITLIAIARTTDAERSAVIGSVTAFVDVALAVGAFVLGAVAAAADYAGAFLVASAISASGILLLARLDAERRPELPAAT